MSSGRIPTQPAQRSHARPVPQRRETVMRHQIDGRRSFSVEDEQKAATLRLISRRVPDCDQADIASMLGVAS